MKITILGATGDSGKSVVEQALRQGHKVHAVLRSPEKLPQEIRGNPNFSYAKANIFNVDELSQCFKGSDAIVSCLGVSGFLAHFQTITLYSEAIESIILAMKKQSIRRLVAMSSWYTVDSDEYPTFMNWFVKPVILGRILYDMGRMEDYVRQVPDIDYTFVRPPGLSNQPITDKNIVRVENVSWIQGFAEAAGMIPRANVAKFILECLAEKSHVQKCVAIGVQKDQ